MTLVRLAASRSAGRFGHVGSKATTTTTTIQSNIIFPASLAARWYSGPPIQVTHYESGWTADGVDGSVKGIEKYCTQTFNKISQVVSTKQKGHP
jgi:hypothetical protein